MPRSSRASMWAAEVHPLRAERRGRRLRRRLLHAALQQRPRRQRHGHGAARHRRGAARRGLDLRRARRPAGRHRRRAAHRHPWQRAAPGRRHQRHHQRHHRGSARALRGLLQPAGVDPEPPSRSPRDERTAGGRSRASDPPPPYDAITHTCTKEGNNDVRTSAKGASRGHRDGARPGRRARRHRLLRLAGDGGATGGSGGGGDANLAITFLPKNLGNPYFDTSNAAARRRSRSSAAPSPRSARPRPARRPRSATSRPPPSRASGALVISANDPERSATRSTRRARPASRSSPSTPTPTRTAATCSSTRPTAEGIAKVQVDLSPSRSATRARSPSSRRRPTRPTRTPGSS